MAHSYSIRAAAQETGLTTHTIRAWERRYGVLSPGRSETNRRQYDANDVRRLRLLHQAVKSGHSIGMIAALSDEDLLALTGKTGRPETISLPDVSENIVGAALAALENLDSAELESLLVRSMVVLGVDAFLDEVAVPMLSRIGEGWRSGEATIAQEHLASALLKTHLERTRLSIQPSKGAPRIVVATTSGQRHEIGAMMAAIVAARMDWHVTYLGADLPAEDIADAAARTSASAVALSLIHPYEDAVTSAQLRRLVSLLRPGVALLVGGEASRSYTRDLEEIGAIRCPDFTSLRDRLSELRGRA